VRAQVFQARQRGYSSSLAAALEPNEVPLDVYHTLLTSVRAGLPLLHRYLSLRKQILGVDELHLYDVRAPLVPTVEVSFDYPSAQEIVRKALACLGSEYRDVLDQILTSRWIDVYETPHKYGIPYSDGSYTTPPFTLLNFHGTLASLGSMAHELGHAAHAYFSRSVQPYIAEDPASFVAEVASNLNEALVSAYLTETSNDPAVSLHLIADEVDSMRFTIFRQAMFAQFELEMHERVEAGDALTADWLCGLYASLVREFHGPDVAIDQLIAWEWIVIPHFFSPFYVYQYASGKAAALTLREHILSGGAPAVHRYIQFLKSGSSRSPMMLLRDTGADMSTSVPIQRALQYFSTLLDELESRAIRTL
jgi:oligoendopeptidase F